MPGIVEDNMGIGMVVFTIPGWQCSTNVKPLNKQQFITSLDPLIKICVGNFLAQIGYSYLGNKLSFLHLQFYIRIKYKCLPYVSQGSNFRGFREPMQP